MRVFCCQHKYCFLKKITAHIYFFARNIWLAKLNLMKGQRRLASHPSYDKYYLKSVLKQNGGVYGLESVKPVE